MSTIQFTYFNAATNKVDATKPELFTVAGITKAMESLTSSNLGENEKIVGAEVMRAGAGALPASVPERIVGGADAETHILRLVVAAAPQRSPFDPGGPDSGNPRRNNVVSIVDAFDAGVDDVSSGLYFSLAATAAPASFEVLHQLLATYLEYESNYTAKSPKRAAALLGVPADHADVVLRGGSAARLVSAAFASACTCPAAYAASTGVDSVWIRAVMQQLRRTLLPLVNADRFTNTSGKKTQIPLGRKNSGLADACSAPGVAPGSLYSVLQDVIAKINAAAGDPPGTAVGDFFAGDNAPLYCGPDSDEAVDSSARNLLTTKPLKTTTLADVRAFSRKHTDPGEVTLTLNDGTYTGSIESVDAEAGVTIDPRPRVSTNTDAFIQGVDATAYEVSVEGTAISVKQQHKLADNVSLPEFVLRYTTRPQNLIEQAVEAFVRKHAQLMATLPRYLDDLVRAKM